MRGWHRCTCEFCTGVKSWADNWCARCAEVKMAAPKSSDNLDVCGACEREMAVQRMPRIEHDSGDEDRSGW